MGQQRTRSTPPRTPILLTLLLEQREEGEAVHAELESAGLLPPRPRPRQLGVVLPHPGQHRRQVVALDLQAGGVGQGAQGQSVVWAASVIGAPNQQTGDTAAAAQAHLLEHRVHGGVGRLERLAALDPRLLHHQLPHLELALVEQVLRDNLVAQGRGGGGRGKWDGGANPQVDS